MVKKFEPSCQSGFLFIVGFVTLLVSSFSFAELKLGAPFSDHMMVQADQPVTIWGWDVPGTDVVATFAGFKKTVTCDDAGRWVVEFPAVSEVGPYMLRITGSRTIEVDDVIAGDIWWCAGQSNMAWTVKKSKEAVEVQKNANDQELRLLKLPRVSDDLTQDYIPARWQTASNISVEEFSAVAYFFGHALRRETGRPIGLVEASWGGSSIQAWVSSARLVDSPYYSGLNETREAALRVFKTRLANWEAEGRLGKKPGVTGAGRPQHRLSGIYNGMTHPMRGIRVRGAIWYQGESNASSSEVWEDLLPRLVDDLRDNFVSPNMPVYFVQLPNMNRPDWPAFREMQRSLHVKGTDMAVTIDVGQADDVHPPEKRPVGERLARLALADSYKRNIVPGGPRVVGIKFVAELANVLEIQFDRVGEGLKSSRSDGDLGQFVIVGSDGQSYFANADIHGQDILRIHWDSDIKPVRVRYAYEPSPDAFLINSEGLPASPFDIGLE